MQGKWGGCVRVTSQPGLAQAGSGPPSGTIIRTSVSFFPATQLRAPRILSLLWSMVDVPQAWEDVTTPAKHRQRALGYLSQHGYNKDSRAQRWGHTSWRPQSLPDQSIHGGGEVGDRSNPLPTLSTAAIIHSALDDPLSAMG